MRLLKTLFFLFLLGASLQLAARAQTFEGRQLVHAELIADADAIVPGKPITVGLRLQAVNGWHTYWEFAGDAGTPTKIAWTLPGGFKAGAIQWPLPKRANEEGDIENYEYPGEVLLPVEIQAPPDLKPGQSVELKAHASWLVCKDLCVPGTADVSITLPVAAASHPANAQLFAQARSLLPLSGAPPFTTSWSRDGQTLVLTVKGLPAGETFDFFPLPGEVIQIGHPKVAPPTVRIPLLDPKETAKSIDGLIVIKKAGGQEIWPLNAGNTQGQGTGNFQDMSSGAHRSLFYWLCVGFLGGLVLNVMPCVLPVIALKIFSFVRQAGESSRRVVALGFTYVGGIFAWFFFLAALIAGFKLAGHQLNYAFQFQYPGFIAAIIVVLLFFSLNLLGVFELVLPGRAQSAIQTAADQEGYAGTFWHGVFTTLMGTSCTAPFLAPALGFALSQDTPTIFAMFGSFAAGMSAPYALLAAKPGWVRFLPKPGMWMVRVKQAVGVIMLVTVAWFCTILYKELFMHPAPFGQQLDAALAKNKIVFVDCTAAWCVNCHWYEGHVLNDGQVEEAFRQHNVILLKADWTNNDPQITAFLEKFGRAGVPCYVIYPPGRNPILLPDVITKDIVLNALDRAAS